MRARIGAFKDKETRKALYGLYAVIATAKGVNAKAAQQALKVFQQQVLTNKNLTPAQVQQLTRKLLYHQFGPMSVGAANLSRGQKGGGRVSRRWAGVYQDG